MWAFMTKSSTTPSPIYHVQDCFRINTHWGISLVGIFSPCKWLFPLFIYLFLTELSAHLNYASEWPAKNALKWMGVCKIKLTVFLIWWKYEHYFPRIPPTPPKEYIVWKIIFYLSAVMGAVTVDAVKSWRWLPRPHAQYVEIPSVHFIIINKSTNTWSLFILSDN